MKIVDIFATRNLFAVHYDGAHYNEYRRLMELWEDTEALEQFLKANSKDIPPHKSVYTVLEEIIEESYEINDTLLDIIETEPINIDSLFAPLDNSEYREVLLSIRKGKGRTKHLRLYAIKIARDTYLITGGAIKLPLHHLMDDRIHTKLEKQKLINARDYLRSKGVHDKESFFEFLNDL